MVRLDKKYFTVFEGVGRPLTLRAGAVLYMQGDRASSLYLIKSGRVRLFYMGEGGREITYRIIGEGQLVGEAAFLSHLQQATISAVTDTALVVCPVQDLYPHISRSGEVSRAIFSLLAENYTALCNQLRRLTIPDSRKRVASYLLGLTAEDRGELGILRRTLPYTQEELAVCLNLHRTTVARALAGFAAAGYVRLGYKKIQVLEPEALRAAVLEEREEPGPEERPPLA